MRLIDCFVLLIAHVAHLLRNTLPDQPAYDAIRGDIGRLIEQSEVCKKEGDVNHADFDMARFAVFAWIDEAIMNSAWDGKHQWQKELLQRRYYNTVDAGELFFDRLNQIGIHQRDIREVYYICLAMGFAGQYRDAGDSVLLEGLKNENLKILTGTSMGLPTLMGQEIFPQAYATAPGVSPAPPRGKLFSPVTGIFLGAPVLLYALLYLVYRFVLSNIGGSFIQTVS